MQNLREILYVWSKNSLTILEDPDQISKVIYHIYRKLKRQLICFQVCREQIQGM